MVAPTKVIGAAFAAVLARLEDAGAVLEPVRLPGEDLLGMFQVLWFAGAAARLRAVPESAHGAIDPGLPPRPAVRPGGLRAA
jgi:amidase/aspartyl-tRNA(Asn)/glutamyl-tRNA(Gln) amidotransferase subunit A